jgi:hypothetical protein
MNRAPGKDEGSVHVVDNDVVTDTPPILLTAVLCRKEPAVLEEDFVKLSMIWKMSNADCGRFIKRSKGLDVENRYQETIVQTKSYLPAVVVITNVYSRFEGLLSSPTSIWWFF